MWNTKSICLFLLGFIGVGTVEGQTSVDSYEYSSYVDPRIGSEGLGRVFIGPSCPYGMVKPSPDCTPSPNSGWLPMPERVDGFAQVHVSVRGEVPSMVMCWSLHLEMEWTGSTIMTTVSMNHPVRIL